MTERHYLLQFRSETDDREEYILMTAKEREEWDKLAEPGFKLTAAVIMAHTIEGHWSNFLLPHEHRYWLRDAREDNLPAKPN